MRVRPLLAALSILSTFAGPALAADYYVAPLGTVQSCTADGSKACPWLSIDAAFASKKIVGGDNILLLDGDFGPVPKLSAAFDSVVTIQSLNGRNAHLSYVHFESTAKNIRLRNLTIWRDNSDTDTSFLVRAYAGSSFLTFEGLELRSRADANNYMSWSADRWLAVATMGMDLRGTNFVVRNCTITGASVGIATSGQYALVEGNTVDGFTKDGINGISNSTFRNNLIKNLFNVVAGFHSDGFQAYEATGTTGLVLEGNRIIEWSLDPSNPLKGSLQGIGLFAGWYTNLTIRNNLVVTNNYHGISVYGANGATITNNTVVSLSGAPGTYPWIMVTAVKDGGPSQNVVLANNLAMQFSVTPDAALNVVSMNNSVILDPAAAFTDLKAFDYRPLAASGFLDTGNAADAPAIDILGAARPFGAGPDRGAYEVGASSSTSTSGGTTTTTDGGTTTSTSGGTTSGGTTTTTDGTTTTSGGTTTTSGGTTTTDGGTTTSGGTTSGGNVKGWVAKFLKPPKK